MAQSTLSGQTVRIAFIDPLSGPMADVGRNSLRSWEFMAERKSGAGNAAGVRFKIAGFDNKGSPQESLNMLKAAIDQGFRYIVQGHGSGVAAALSEAVTRHNTQNPDRAILLINYAAMDPALTNDRCSFWHFRIDADASMKLRALLQYLAQQTTLERLYLLNPNYVHGQQIPRHFRREAESLQGRLTVVGEELHPPAQVEDFAPTIERIKASGAQAVVTGHWGVELGRLVDAMQKAGLNLPLFGYYASVTGTPTELWRAKATVPVYQVAYLHSNQESPARELMAAFRQRHGEDLGVLASYDGLEMLGQAMYRVGSSEPSQVASRLSGMIFTGFSGPVQIRADDHQLLKGLYISRWQKTTPEFPNGAEGTDHAFVPVQFVQGSQISGQTTCEMQRP